MATQGQFVHRPGAFLPIRERLLTGVKKSSREGGGSGEAVRYGRSDVSRLELASGTGYPVGDHRSRAEGSLIAADIDKPSVAWEKAAYQAREDVMMRSSME